MTNQVNKAVRRLDDFLHAKLMPPHWHPEAIKRVNWRKRLDFTFRIDVEGIGFQIWRKK
jgi:hypothetical protein